MKKTLCISMLKGFMILWALLLGGVKGISQVNETDTVFIPERAVMLHGDQKTADKDVMAVFYSRENLAFNDPDAPRFLFLDREGKVVFGIGGQLYATGSYDFKGAVDGPGFETFDISVPDNPANRSRLGADLSHSSLFIRLVGKSTKLGMYEVYFQSNFTGNDGGYGFLLEQAYATLNHLTLGLTNSTFVDPGSQAPTIDVQGPSGQIAGKNVLFRYKTSVRKGFSGALSVELPKYTYTLSEGTERLSPRVPDVPAYVQYSWKTGQHIRLSGIFRDLGYRDLKTGKNILKPGYGIQLSAISDVDQYGIVQFFGHMAFGRGIGQYVNDLSGNGYDLVYDSRSGTMTAPEMMGWTAGLYVNATKKLMFTGSFSRSQVYRMRHLGDDSYRYGQYVDVNGFFNIDPNFRVGAEYLHGWRKDYSGQTGQANRLNVLLQYSF